MKPFKLILAMGLLWVFFIAGIAFAQGWGGQGKGGRGGPMLRCQERFDTLDADHDGKLTKEEFMAAPHPRGNAERMFKTMDVNGRGYVDKEEFCSKGGGRGMGRGMGANPAPTPSTGKTQ